MTWAIGLTSYQRNKKSAEYFHVYLMRPLVRVVHKNIHFPLARSAFATFGLKWSLLQDVKLRCKVYSKICVALDSMVSALRPAWKHRNAHTLVTFKKPHCTLSPSNLSFLLFKTRSYLACWAFYQLHLFDQAGVNFTSSVNFACFFGDEFSHGFLPPSFLPSCRNIKQCKGRIGGFTTN